MFVWNINMINARNTSNNVSIPASGQMSDLDKSSKSPYLKQSFLVLQVSS